MTEPDYTALDDRFDAEHGITDADMFDGPPIPLTTTAPVPPFPTDAFPAAVRDMVEAVARATQTDPAMAATSALSALSACTGGHARIQIRTGWREPLCLYTVTVAAPGERKSAVQQDLLAPILAVEERLAHDGHAASVEAETLKQIAVADAEKARRAASSADPGEKSAKQAEAIAATQQADAIVVPAIPRLIADDVTPEAAAGVLAEQGGRLAIISAEGGIFDTIGGRYSSGVPNLDLFLKGFSGEPVRVDRRGRAPEHIKSATITLGLMVQPSVLANLARNDAFQGRGLLARIMWALPVSRVGRREIAPPPVPDDVRDRYGQQVGTLAAELAGWLGDPAVIMLTDDAARRLLEFETQVEPTLGPGGTLAVTDGSREWGAKYVGAVARIIGLLHLAEHGEAGTRMPVAAETVTAAIKIGAYYRATAINVFGQLGDDDVTADARYLLERVERHAAQGNTDISERDMHQASRGRFKAKQDVMPALERLVDHEYLLPVPVDTSGPGRKPSPRYLINPYSQSSQSSKQARDGDSERSEQSEKWSHPSNGDRS